MKTAQKFILAFLIILSFEILPALPKPDNFSKLKGPWLGQKPPGMTPEIFAPGIISTDANEGCCCFSKDGRLFLFARGNSDLTGILLMEQKDNFWTRPRLAPFSAGTVDWDFMLAPDDKTVFISSGRPIVPGGEVQRDYRIWTSERSDQGWSEPFLLPHPVNTGSHDSYPSVSEIGTLYFFSNRGGGLGAGDIYKSQKIAGKYKSVENLGSTINSEYHEVDAFIAPDESYLIFCSDKPDGFGRADIYISFRTKNGMWSEPVNMGENINTSFSEYIPWVSPDSRYFFFTSNKSGDRDIYWVDAKIIEELK